MNEKYQDIITNMSNPNYVLGRIRRLEDMIGFILDVHTSDKKAISDFAEYIQEQSYENNPNPECDPVNRDALEDVRRGWLDGGRSVSNAIRRSLDSSI